MVPNSGVEMNLPQTPSRGSFILGCAVAAALLAAALVGCRSTAASPPIQHVLTTTLAAYHIEVSSDRTVTLESRDNYVIITFGNHRLLVEKGRVVLDDNETAAFPITATHIAIEVARSMLRVTADGQEMWKKSFLSE